MDNMTTHQKVTNKSYNQPSIKCWPWNAFKTGIFHLEKIGAMKKIFPWDVRSLIAHSIWVYFCKKFTLRNLIKSKQKLVEKFYISDVMINVSYLFGDLEKR